MINNLTFLSIGKKLSFKGADKDNWRFERMKDTYTVF